MSDAFAVALPPKPYAVMVYVPAAPTSAEPEEETQPTLEMYTPWSALVVVHVRVAVEPSLMVEGVMEMEAVAAGATVTVLVQLPEPPAPETVPVYVVVVCG